MHDLHEKFCCQAMKFVKVAFKWNHAEETNRDQSYFEQIRQNAKTVPGPNGPVSTPFLGKECFRRLDNNIPTLKSKQKIINLL